MNATHGSLLLLLALAAPAHSQSYTIAGHRVDGGGGTGNGGSYTLRHAIGQPTSGAMYGSGYTLQGGFLAALMVPSTTGSPTLYVQASAQGVIISWTPAATGFSLEQTSSLSPPSWSPAPPGNPVVIPLGTTPAFFRLHGP